MNLLPKISVVVPAFNEQANVEQTLACLVRQTLPRDSFEVIVVDNGSTDETVARARSLQAQLNLRILEMPHSTISEVRNHGAAAALAPVLAFLDADCTTDADWLERALACASDNTMWGAHYRVQRDASWVGRVWFQHQAVERSGAVSFLPASCLMTAKSVFQSLGGFDPRLRTSEDVDLSTRAKLAGIQVLAYPELAVYHEGTPRTLAGFYRQNRWHGKNIVRLLKDLPSTRNYPLVFVTLYTFVMFWATPIVPLFMLPRHPWLAFLPLALLLILPILLAIDKGIRNRAITDVPQLAVLYFTYLLARAAALVRTPPRSHR